MVNLNKLPQEGDGKTGEDITHNVLGITCIPKSIKMKKPNLSLRLEVRFF